MTELEPLRVEWKTLYSQTLPQLARKRDPAQTKWPVSLDHCFARIILDNTVGEGSRQWDTVIKKPAVKNMTVEQLRDAIALGEKILSGDMNLVELDQISLMCRGKNEGKYGGNKVKDGNANITKSVKRKSEDPSLGSPSKKQKRGTDEKQSKLPFASASRHNEAKPLQSTPKSTSSAADGSKPNDTDFKATLQRIRSHQSLTTYRKRLYTVLLSVPRGRYTTYAAMSDHLDSSARAVGNGMRNNPFAPDVPCHRVVAADGSLGGFHGHWGKEGKYANDKIKLLRSEGVKFDGKGKVVGEVFRKFHEFEDM